MGFLMSLYIVKLKGNAMTKITVEKKRNAPYNFTVLFCLGLTLWIVTYAFNGIKDMNQEMHGTYRIPLQQEVTLSEPVTTIDLHALEEGKYYYWELEDGQSFDYDIVCNGSLSTPYTVTRGIEATKDDENMTKTLFCPLVVTPNGIISNVLHDTAQTKLVMHYDTADKEKIDADTTNVMYASDILAKTNDATSESETFTVTPEKEYLYNDSDTAIVFTIEKQDGTLSQPFTLFKDQMLEVQTDKELTLNLMAR